MIILANVSAKVFFQEVGILWGGREDCASQQEVMCRHLKKKKWKNEIENAENQEHKY